MTLSSKEYTSIAQTEAPLLFSIHSWLIALWRKMSRAPLKKLPKSPYVLQVGLDDPYYLLSMNRQACGVDFYQHVVDDLGKYGLRLRVGDIFADMCLPYPNEEFEAVVIMDVLEFHNRSTIERLLCDAWRVLRPGGILLIMTANEKGFEKGRTLEMGYETLLNDSTMRLLTEGKFWMDDSYSSPLSGIFGGDLSVCNRRIFRLKKF